MTLDIQAPLEAGFVEADLIPMIRRIAAMDATAVVRLRTEGGLQTGFARLPSVALVARTVPGTGSDADVTVLAQDVIRWVHGGVRPTLMDVAWRSPLPPRSGWHVLDRVPAAVVLSLVAQGQQAHADLTRRGGTARDARELLDQVVLTVQGGADDIAACAGPTRAGARVTNRALSALTSMGFIPVDGAVSVSVVGRWTKCTAEYGSAFTVDDAPGLTLLPRRPG